MAGQPTTRYCKPVAAANDFKEKAERGGASAHGTNLINTSLKSIKLFAIVCGGYISFFRARLFIWLNAKPGNPLLASKPASTRPNSRVPERNAGSGLNLGPAGYSRIMWSQKVGCFRARAFMFLGPPEIVTETGPVEAPAAEPFHEFGDLFAPGLIPLPVLVNAAGLTPSCRAMNETSATGGTSFTPSTLSRIVEGA